MYFGECFVPVSLVAVCSSHIQDLRSKDILVDDEIAICKVCFFSSRF